MPPLPDKLANELARLKAYFPYRLVWVAHKDGEWDHGCHKTKRQLNDKVRTGWTVGTI